MRDRVGSVETVSQGAATRQALGRLVVETPGPGFTELTDALAAWVSEQPVAAGLLTVFCRHTSASLTIQENADPDVQTDLLTALDRLAPEDAPWVHTVEGPDDMPAHVKSMLTGVSLHVPVASGALALGTWQGVYLIEHRDRPHRREVLLHLVGA